MLHFVAAFDVLSALSLSPLSALSLCSLLSLLSALSALSALSLCSLSLSLSLSALSLSALSALSLSLLSLSRSLSHSQRLNVIGTDTPPLSSTVASTFTGYHSASSSTDQFNRNDGDGNGDDQNDGDEDELTRRKKCAWWCDHVEDEPVLEKRTPYGYLRIITVYARSGMPTRDCYRRTTDGPLLCRTVAATDLSDIYLWHYTVYGRKNHVSKGSDEHGDVGHVMPATSRQSKKARCHCPIDAGECSDIIMPSSPLTRSKASSSNRLMIGGSGCV